MDNKILQFPQPHETVADPAAERALFFLDCEMAEMSLVIPQAHPTQAP